MKYLVLVLWIVLSSTSSAFSSPHSIEHTVKWESGVNKRVVKEWSYSLDKVSNVSSTTYIRKKVGGKDDLHAVKHRDVIVWIPKNANLNSDFIAVIWFHGHFGYFPKRTFQDRTLKQFVPLVDNKNFVVIIPEMPWSVHTKTPKKRNSLLWMKEGSFLSFIKQVEYILLEHSKPGVHNDTTRERKLGKIDYRVVGHSAGGSTIMRLGITGDLCRLNPSMVVWSDSSYGRWLDRAWDGCLKDTNILVKVFVQKWQSPYRNATRFLGNFQGSPQNLELYVKNKGWSHKLIGDNIVKLSGLLGE